MLVFEPLGVADHSTSKVQVPVGEMSVFEQLSFVTDAFPSFASIAPAGIVIVFNVLMFVIVNRNVLLPFVAEQVLTTLDDTDAFWLQFGELPFVIDEFAKKPSFGVTIRVELCPAFACSTVAVHDCPVERLVSLHVVLTSVAPFAGENVGSLDPKLAALSPLELVRVAVKRPLPLTQDQSDEMV